MVVAAVEVEEVAAAAVSVAVGAVISSSSSAAVILPSRLSLTLMLHAKYHESPVHLRWNESRSVNSERILPVENSVFFASVAVAVSGIPVWVC